MREVLGRPDLGPRTSDLGRRGGAAVALLLVCVAACGGSSARQPEPQPSNVYRGMASWYGEPQMTASGERFNPRALTAAHRSLPLGTRVRVTNTHNGKSVVVRINDRGPYSHARIIDLSEAAAKLLDMIAAGVVPVVLEVLP
jgi:rare lipoprotein A (peptidoglycan hydrolase)